MLLTLTLMGLELLIIQVHFEWTAVGSAVFEIHLQSLLTCLEL